MRLLLWGIAFVVWVMVLIVPPPSMMLLLWPVNLLLRLLLLPQRASAVVSAGEYVVGKSWLDARGGWHGTLQHSRARDKESRKRGAGDSTVGRLRVDAVAETATRLRVTIDDADSPRATVPEAVLPLPAPQKDLDCRSPAGNCNVRFAAHSEAPFAFSVLRRGVGKEAVLFNSSAAPLVYQSQLISLATEVSPGSRIFGLMESTRKHFSMQPGETRTMWAQDKPSAMFDANVNTYGSHPFYVSLGADGTAHGVLMLNSNGMDISLSKDSSRLTYNIIGGIVDLYIFSGPTVDDVVAQYTEAVGRPAMMPRWALGFHNCRWGYKSLKELKAVTASYTAAGIPITTFWMDIDYMHGFRDFTTDPVAFPAGDFAAYVDQLHARGQRFVVILDPGIKIEASYAPYTEGLAAGIFVRDGFTGGPYTGVVWPGAVHYPDFLHPNASEWWGRHIRTFLKTIPADGLWVDMNEVSNFCNTNGRGQECHLASQQESAACPPLAGGQLTGSFSGNCCKGTDDRVVVCRTLDPENLLDFPPYSIGNQGQPLGTKTLPPSSLHFGNVRDYDVHSTYGSLMTKATVRALLAAHPGRRPFVLSRSTFVGHGAHAAHWLGDNDATWQDLQASVTGILSFSLLGVPMVGSDICGFFGNTNPELCTRWIQVGAFAPFSRVHNSLDQRPQELYRWKSVAEAARLALGLRYRLLPYLYTLFYEAHTTGSMVARPFFAAFPGDPEALAATERQFMLGDALLVSPVLTPRTTVVRSYFPKGAWYSLVDGQPSVNATVSGRWVDLYTPLRATNVHVRGGRVLPMQREVHSTTAESLELLIVLDERGRAEGRLFLDDGEQPHVGRDAVHLHFDVGCPSHDCALEGELSVRSAGGPPTPSWPVPPVRSVRILGLQGPAPSRRLSFSLNSLPFATTDLAEADGSSARLEGIDLPITRLQRLRWKVLPAQPLGIPDSLTEGERLPEAYITGLAWWLLFDLLAVAGAVYGAVYGCACRRAR